MKMKCKFLLATVLCLLTLPYVRAQEVYRIYEGLAPVAENLDYPELTIPNPWSGSPTIYNVTDPSITVYRPARQINTGAAVIIAPGGANMYLSWREEGEVVAEWFQRHGITGIVLKYRTDYMGKDREEIARNQQEKLAVLNSMDGQGSLKANEQTNPMMKLEPSIQGDDGRQAIRYVRAHAAELGIDPSKVGIIGFSAGGILACNVLYFHDESSKPDFAAPIYGFLRAGLPEDPCPVFLCGPVMDLFEPDLAFGMYRAFQQARVPCELHFIQEASHGEGLGYNGRAWNEWIQLLYNFMKAIGVLSGK